MRITKNLSKLEHKAELNESAEEDYIEQGKYCIEDKDYYASQGDYIVNNSDSVNLNVEREWGEGKEKHFGCCGLNGSKGLNSECKNSHLITTKITECNTPHCTILDKEKVEIRESNTD